MPLHLVTIFKMFTCSLYNRKCALLRRASTLLLFGLQVIQKPSKSIHMEWVYVIQIDAHIRTFFDIVQKCIATVSLRFLQSLKCTTTISTNFCLPLILQQFNYVVHLVGTIILTLLW